MRHSIDNDLGRDGTMISVLDQELENIDGGAGGCILIGLMITGAFYTYVNNHY